ncbi:unnamed protein product [Acanthoscelides obtectus]|uniref:Uncharacterized protein n=1 Tax=Acanthoscelides obtectus TaxID=200917 RepID=A0A9P0JQE4_ACAOB|nr:unnamed protein product [Acanthoscelides obtectus]CAK1661879.1 hypothetical protein AOBTE_LOCUS22855 [Acanthoscelides obtectus]
MLTDISPVPKLRVEAAKRRSRSVASELSCTSNIESCREKFEKRKILKSFLGYYLIPNWDLIRKLPKRQCKLAHSPKNKAVFNRRKRVIIRPSSI